MNQMSISELATAIGAIAGPLIAMVAWLFRLEGRVNRNTERISDNEKTLESGDNRMNTIDGKIGDTLSLMYRELQLITKQFNDTSNQVSKLEGMLQYKNNMDSNK